MLEAARAEFLARGYEGTRIADIADAAGVSRPTVYAVGTKAELMKLVRDVAIAGDDEPVAVPDRPPVADMHAATDPESALRIHARNVTRIHARYAQLSEVLRQAAGSDPALRDLWDQSEQERLRGATIVVDDIQSKGQLRPGVDRDRAIDILWVLMAPEHHLRLGERGWDDDAYEAWLADAMVSLLLA